MMRMLAAAMLAALLLASPLEASRQLAGSGPAYWQEPARYPMHYPAAAAAAEGFVVNPMGGQTYCNARLVKPVCADGIWVQNRCIAELQALKVVPDHQCPETKDVFAGMPTTSGTAAAVTQPVPVTAADLKKHADRGYVFRGVAAAGVPGNWRVRQADALLESRPTRGLIEPTTRFWWTAPSTAQHNTPK